MNFSDCLAALKSSHRMARSAWVEKGMYLKIVYGDEIPSKFCLYRVKTIDDTELLSWIGLKTTEGKFVPWAASHTDILADDWVDLSK